MARLDEIFDLQMGKTPSRSNADYWTDGQYDWVSIADLGTYKKYVEDTKEKISASAVQESGIKSVPANTVIMSFKLSLGKTAITQEPVYTNEAIMAFIPTGKYTVLPDYFYYLFSAKDWTKGTNRAVMGTTLNKATLGAVSVTVPPLNEQRKIVMVLDKVRDLIAKRRTQLDKLDELVKSRFIEMFGEKYPFDKIENLIDRKIVSARKIFSQHDVIKYIDISSIDNIKNKIDRYTEYQMTDAPSRAQQCIKENDIIVSTVRPNLKNIAINQMKYDNLVVSSGFCVLRPKKCNPLYLFIALLQDNFTNKMIEKTTGANYPAIKDSDVYLFQIPLPPIELQNQFAAFVKQTDKSKLAIQKNLEKLEILKKSLMQKYFD